MKLTKLTRAITGSHPIEIAKGGLKGLILKTTKPKRQALMKKLRGNRKTLSLQKKTVMNLIKNALKNSEVKSVKVFGRIKTIGSFDRKEKYSRIIYPKHSKEFLKEDIIGVTVLVKSESEARSALNKIKKIGNFPKLDYRPNPRDYFKTPTEKRPEVQVNNAIIGNIKINGVLVHLKIMTRKSYFKEKAYRHKYKKRIKKTIEKAETKKS